MLQSIRGLHSSCCKDCKVIYKLWRWKIVKQNELDGDLEFTTTIGLGGKLANYWKSNRKQIWKWRGVCKAYRNPILESYVGQTSFENKRKVYGAQVGSTIRSGTTGCMDWGSSEKAQFQMIISMEKDVVNYSSKWANVVYLSIAIYGLEL
jgi:hypothetical protein